MNGVKDLWCTSSRLTAVNTDMNILRPHLHYLNFKLLCIHHPSMPATDWAILVLELSSTG